MRLELRGITKRFGSFTANSNIDLTVEPGQIHCLLGENGAGKSTLMNVLFGLLHADEGEILVDGEPANFANSGDAGRRGIGMVHQHFMLVPVFTVAENVVLGFEPTKSFNRLDYRRASEEIREVSRTFNLEVDPDAVVEACGRAGIVWHTQGSGKSYTMVFYVWKLRTDPRFANPTIVALTDREGNVIAWESAGSAGFKGSRKSTPFAAQVTADAAARKGMEHGLQKVEVFVKGPGSGRETAIRSLQAAGLEILSVKDVTPQAHNGVRPRKRRRV